jgi:hypothetical protein
VKRLIAAKTLAAMEPGKETLARLEEDDSISDQRE